MVPIINFEFNETMSSNTEQNLYYYTMPLAKSNLRDFLIQYRQDNPGFMDDETAVFYFNQLLDGISFAHREGVIHRDLKPENILVFEEEGKEVLKLSDFGFGKYLNGDTFLTKTQTALGTNFYAPPEQLKDSKNTDETADIYSLGVILYELLTYDHPAYINIERLNNSKLKFIVNKATKGRKENRFHSIEEMKDRINMVMGYNNALKSTTKQFQSVYDIYNNKYEEIYMREIVDILLENNLDFILYTEKFMNMDEDDIAIMAVDFPDDFSEVVENFLSLIQGDHPFSFTDKLANMIVYKIFPVMRDTDFDLYEKAFKTLLIMAFRHNRFYIAKVIEDEILTAENNQQIITIGDVLKENPQPSKWLYKHFKEKHKLCRYISDKFDQLL
ncbi:protein kinase [Bacillus mojavensis]|nr:protein kinase [Bacillus mojavensis]MEC1776000.1 protein kinase [Bacillus mojavensis]MEC1801208.1 protein kinase [Bacillus mojavensis]